MVEEFADGELVDFGEGAALPFPTKGFGLEALTTAGGAGIVGAIASEEDAHVHLVGVLLQPPEKPFYAIPIFGPGLPVFFPVAGLAVDDEGLVFGRQRGERNVGGDFFLFRENVEVFFRFAVDLALPAFDRAVVERERLVGDGEAVVDVDHAAEPTAFRASAEGRVEGKQRG